LSDLAAHIGDHLLEREAELVRATKLLQDVERGHGGHLVIEGPAGIGKTVLLEQLCALAREAGLLVLRARGGEVERDFPLGVVRQLFEGYVRARSNRGRAQLLTGAAELAGPIVAPELSAGGAGAGADSSFAVEHGLYWLTVNIAEAQPACLVVDDTQWCDVSSLRFLLHLARRLEGVQLLLALGIRTGEPLAEEALLSQLTSQPSAVVLRPQPLSEAGVARMILARAKQEPDAEFAAACHKATGGTPFLVSELISEIAERGIPPTLASVRDLSDMGPETVARATLQRLGQLPAAAADLARAVAVLGADGQLHRAARFAGIEPDAAIEAVDALVGMNILRPGRPLDFVHPIVRGAVYRGIPAGTRSAAHARAAEMLTTEGAEIDAIATHLLLAEPMARASTVEHLREAADQALARGAPESATTYLHRALDEDAADRQERARLVLQLGRAERIMRPPAAVQHYRAAHRLTDDPVQRARIVYELVDTQFYIGRWADAIPLVESAIADAENRDRELALRLEALRATHEYLDDRAHVGLVRRLPKLRAVAGKSTEAERVIALLVAGVAAWIGEPREEVHRLLELGLHDGRLPRGERGESWLLTHVMTALALTEETARALEIAEEAIVDAQRRGSILGVGVTCGHRAWVHARRGDLVSAEADMRAALKMIREHLFAFGERPAFWYGVDALIDRVEVEDEARKVMALEIGAEPETRSAWPLFIPLETRGRVRLAFGDLAGAVEDLERCGETPQGYGNPNGLGWRPALAVALAQTDRARALEIAHGYLVHARGIGMPRAIGVGLRTLGLVEGGREGGAHLEEAVQVLERSPARLEHARALIELGAARRRAGERAAAREPLRRGFDLAHRCGATRLEQRARSELTATGARPRRAMLTGRDALTATEQRVAGMAADGMSNREIAQALFVTIKTVENHLSRIYQKLGIGSREQLAEALAEDQSAVFT
jgi:DNA-binding CsgD family transcriptional regulator